MSDFAQGPGWWQASDGKWYPPDAHPAQPYPPPALFGAQGYPLQWQYGYPPDPRQQPKKIYQNTWFWILIVAAVGLGNCIAVVSLGGDFLSKIATTPHTVVYTVSGSGTADITFTNGNSGNSQVTAVLLPWKKTVVGSGLFSRYDVVATADTGASVTCTIALDGRQVAKNTATSQFASADCTAVLSDFGAGTQ